MEIGQRYRFRVRASHPNHKIGSHSGKEFIIVNIRHARVEYQIIGSPDIGVVPIGFWNIYVEPGYMVAAVKESIQGNSKLEFKFI